MTRENSLFSSRNQFWAFWMGCVAVTAGVMLHLPMFLMAKDNGYRLAGMPMGGGMLLGMFLILLGFAGTAYGLIPKRRQAASFGEIAPPEEALLTRAHWVQIVILAVALVIDVMKAASLGFVTPGIRVEYGLSFAQAARLPFAALLGTTVGSFIWGALADRYGRRASILLAAVMFMGTAICGAMPTFGWNIFMCFLMGVGAGGMLPVAFALLAEIMPTRHRGWSLVLVGGVGSIGGYFATSALSALLQPTYGWRIMWLINMPIALILIFVSPYLQESARFLQSMGRTEEAHKTLARFGIALRAEEGIARPEAQEETKEISRNQGTLSSPSMLGLTATLTLTALCVGFVTFGVMLWLPGTLIHEGRTVGSASRLLAESSLLAAPTVLLVTWMYSVWSSKRTLMVALAVTTIGLGLILMRNLRPGSLLASPVVSITLLIVGTNAIISALLPYAAESYPLKVRGRATGWVAGFSKSGGLFAQLLGMFALVPALNVAAGSVAVPCVLSILMVMVIGPETHLQDLRELEHALTPVDPTGEASPALDPANVPNCP